ncbi:hypothetical protein E4U43_006117 [Claviceps pusilla]|uniref:Uncharacterized protein n=1 Tax=Claviceps pusilla TaxID=123648 RepID=A0A9P7SYR8_9HYPO|nr:hypothetical protein E4U43_006117 [Claviceps pusilla]
MAWQHPLWHGSIMRKQLRDSGTAAYNPTLFTAAEALIKLFATTLRDPVVGLFAYSVLRTETDFPPYSPDLGTAILALNPQRRVGPPISNFLLSGPASLYFMYLFAGGSWSGSRLGADPWDSYYGQAQTRWGSGITKLLRVMLALVKRGFDGRWHSVCAGSPGGSTEIPSTLTPFGCYKYVGERRSRLSLLSG